MTELKPWPLWLLILLAVVGIPLLGLVLIEGLPHPPSSTGSAGGLIVFPFAAGALILLGATHARPGRSTTLFVIVATTVTLIWLPIMFIGMLAP